MKLQGIDCYLQADALANVLEKLSMLSSLQYT